MKEVTIKYIEVKDQLDFLKVAKHLVASIEHDIRSGYEFNYANRTTGNYHIEVKELNPKDLDDKRREN